MKKILCLFRDMNPYLLAEIHNYAGKHDWLLEISGSWLGPGWYGDGIISDYFSLEELSMIRNIRKIPVISREVHPEPNIRSVIGNTNRIAELTYQHFADKGYTVFAAIEAREWPGGAPDIPHDPVKALNQFLKKKGIRLHECTWDPNRIHDSLTDYPCMVQALTRFFLELPKPAALFISNECYLGTVYRILMDLHFRVPEDVAVLCNTDNISLTDTALIPTSRISGANKETGRKMCELLQRMLDGENVPKPPVLVTPAAIVPRHSTDALVMPDADLTKAINFLQYNFEHFISVKDAADHTGISVCMLNRKFQRYLGKTLYQYLLELRINKIRDLLDGSNLSLDEIATRTGYGSKMALSLAFKRIVGIPPGKFRQERLLNKRKIHHR